MTAELKLYIWTGFSPDYTSGLAIAIAESEEEAIGLVTKEYGTVYTWGELEVRDISKCARCVSGGG